MNKAVARAQRHSQERQEARQSKIRELAEEIEKAIPAKEEMQNQCRKIHGKYVPSIEDFKFIDWLAQNLQIIAQAAGGIRELCEIEEAKVKTKLEVIEQGKGRTDSLLVAAIGARYETKSEVQNG